MGPEKRKSKIVNFRMSPEDHHRCRELCAARGVRSISELARNAVMNCLASNSLQDSNPLTPELHDLRTQVRFLAQEIERLFALVENRKSASA